MPGLSGTLQVSSRHSLSGSIFGTLVSPTAAGATFRNRNGQVRVVAAFRVLRPTRCPHTASWHTPQLQFPVQEMTGAEAWETPSVRMAGGRPQSQAVASAAFHPWEGINILGGGKGRRATSPAAHQLCWPHLAEIPLVASSLPEGSEPPL